MRFSNGWVFLICLLVTVGCGEDKAPSGEADPAQGASAEESAGEGEGENGNISSSQSATEIANKKEQKTRKPGDVIPPRTANTLNRPTVDPLKVSKLADRAVPPRRTPPPKGADAYADFKGTRLAFVHTGNLIGEIDPCG